MGAGQVTLPSAQKKAGSRFRTWLIEQVVGTTFPTYRDDTDEEVAKRIGVQVDVLREARQLFRAREAKAGNQNAKLGRTVAGRSGVLFFLEPPEPIYEEWMAQAKQRDQSSACMLRSVVHHVLRLGVQPDWVTAKRRAAWRYRGNWYGQSYIREHRFRLSTRISENAWNALRARGRATGVSASSIARWGVTAFLEGRLLKVTIVTSLEAMYNARDKYCISPEIRPEKT